jgi:hypothetical protein
MQVLQEFKDNKVVKSGNENKSSYLAKKVRIS